MTTIHRADRSPAVPVAALAALLLFVSSPRPTRGDDAAPAAPTSRPASSISDEAFDKALGQAAEAETGGAGFVGLLQPVAPRFTRVEPSTEAGQARWHELTLNARGKRVDAIRFRVPEGARRDLLWAFAFPPGVSQWYIVPAEGRPGQGFSNFRKATPPELLGDTAPPATTAGIIQTLEGEHLEPGKEYLIWFTFKDEKPATLYVTIALLPTVGNPNATTAIKGLGLPRPLAATHPVGGASGTAPTGPAGNAAGVP